MQALYNSMDKYLQGLFVLANDPVAEVRKLVRDLLKLMLIVSFRLHMVESDSYLILKFFG